MNQLLRLTVLLALAVCVSNQLVAQEKIDFNRDIRPILSDTCFKCHGPDEKTREAGLRLDTKEGAFDDSSIISPGKLDESELYQRIVTDDSSELMPPPDSGRKLTKKQISLLKQWIEQGAKWSKHWSFEPVKAPTVPATVESRKWATNAIDHFVFQQQAKKKLRPSKLADKITLARRVYLDLIGLPPTPEQVKKFLNDKSPNAYEKLVDELLASPHYGEHMARFWLDAARYGDTHGLHLDNYREMWLYRDWVVKAFNQNLSYKEFVVQQLAGDLLPSPTTDQLIATGFNRAHVTTAEGGSIKEEVYVRNVTDRVSTTGTVMMGLTVGCASCHDHKFDPISQKEFYQLFAFFNNLEADPMDGNNKNHAPVMAVPNDAQKKQITELETQVAESKKAFEKALANFKYSEPKDLPKNEQPNELRDVVWIEDDAPAGAKKSGPWRLVGKGKHPVFSGNKSHFEQAGGFTQHFFTHAPTPLVIDPTDTLFSYVYLDKKNPPKQIMLQFNDGSWEHRVYWGANKINWGTDKTPSRKYMGKLPKLGEWIRLEVKASEVGFTKKTQLNGWAFSQWGGKVYWDKSGAVTKQNQKFAYKSFKRWTESTRKSKGAGLPKQLVNVAKKPADKWTDADKNSFRDYFLTNIYAESKKTLDPLKQKSTKLQAQLQRVNAQLPKTLIYKERKTPKPAYFLNRGQYDSRGEKVERETPKSLPAFPKDQPRNRLGLANWLTDGKHPLTARVAVNRIWQQFFGVGIVKTSEDFGAQGQWPSHPELLDYLASDFVKNNWDVKKLVRAIVTSSTYRQSSRMTEKHLALDPDNIWLARGPRFRLDAETLRDTALATGNLLNKKRGGPSVKPPQPDGLWFAVGYSGSNTVRFKKDSGADKVHRRSLYTFWKRTSPPPQMSIADAPSRESCTVRRERTNTPLLALMLMNDPQYVEAARFLAQLSMDQKLKTAQARIDFMIQRTLLRKSTNQEKRILGNAYVSYLAEFKAKPEKAKKLIAIGEKPADKKYDAVELAAMTMIANTLLNLDEFITKN